MRRQFFKPVLALALGAVIGMAGLASATGVSVGHLENCGSCSQDFAGHGRYRPAPEVYWGAAPLPGCVNAVAISRPVAGSETPGIHPSRSGSGANGTSVSFAQAPAPHRLRNDPARSLLVPGAATSPLPFDLHNANGLPPVGVQSAVDNGSSGWSFGEMTSPFHPHPSMLLLASGLVGLAFLRRRKKRVA
jgi:hypothetical protein